MKAYSRTARRENVQMLHAGGQIEILRVLGTVLPSWRIRAEEPADFSETEKG